jgi:hypothetical protein
VGIGQAAPKAKLDINGNLIIGSGYSGSGTVTVPSNGAIIQGNVGIGTSNPGALLDLGLAGTTAGVLRLAGSTSGNVTIQTQAAAGSYTLILPSTIGSANQVLANGSTPGTLSWVTPSAGTVTSVSGTSPITVSNGTTTPSISLGIVPAADGGLGLNTSSSSGYPYVASGTWSVITAATLASNIGALTSANVSGSTNYVAKFTGSNTIGNGIMYDNGSSISISNTNALAPLDVLASGGRDILLGGGSTTNSEIKFLGSNYFSIYNTGSYLTIAQTNALSQTNTAGSPLMSISSGGNVGIGTTSPGFLLDVETSAVTQAKFGSGLPVYIIANSPMVGFNTYWNGGYTYGTSGAAGILTFSQEVSGGFSFNTAASGSSGSSASMTSRLAITNTGNVGVGTTSPAGILDVTSTTSGFLPPRMTDAQRLAISSPVSGMTIYNTTSGCLDYYSNGSWLGLCGSALVPAISYVTSVASSSTSFSITATGAGQIILIVAPGYPGSGTSVTVNGSSATALVNNFSQYCSAYMSLFYYITTGTTNNIVITTNASSSYMQNYAAVFKSNAGSLSGSNLTSPVTVGSNSTSNTYATLSSVPANSYLFGAALSNNYTSNNSAAWGWGPDISQIQNQAVCCQVESSIATGPATNGGTYSDYTQIAGNCGLAYVFIGIHP